MWLVVGGRIVYIVSGEGFVGLGRRWSSVGVEVTRFRIEKLSSGKLSSGASSSGTRTGGSSCKEISSYKGTGLTCAKYPDGTKTTTSSPPFNES